jgi:DNA polymerase III epsilon subunit-like protein
VGNDLAFAVVDVETTGFSPRLHDRLIEIAIIRLDPAGEMQDEYVTWSIPSGMSARRTSTASRHPTLYTRPLLMRSLGMSLTA